MEVTQFENCFNDQPSYRSNWGSLTIHKEHISFEMFNPPSFGGRAKTVIRSGLIKNDTTFNITEFINNYENGKKEKINESCVQVISATFNFCKNTAFGV